MSLQIEELVASIRKEGIDEAEKASQKIILEAEKEAQAIVDQAKKEADAMIVKAEEKIAVRDSSARATLAQAGRDVQLSLKKEITRIIERILQQKVSESLSGPALASLIAEVVKAGEVSSSQAVEVNSASYEKLTKELCSVLAKEMKGGLEIKPVKSVDSGFRIVEKDGSGFYDLSAGEVARMMQPFLDRELDSIIFGE